MYDIYFDLNNMHQVVDDAPAEQLSLLYDELTAVSKAQAVHVEDETAMEIEGEGEFLSFNFELDLPEAAEPLDDFAVVVKKKKIKKPGNGYTCSGCGEIYPYAEEPNQKDGSFKCWACRNF
jgi:DNA-directed RNA polymerase subunit RPC12/RpoP